VAEAAQKLDFVEVAGQREDDSLLFAKLEELWIRMNEQLDRGKIEEASRLEGKLEEITEAAGSMDWLGRTYCNQPGL